MSLREHVGAIIVSASGFTLRSAFGSVALLARVGSLHTRGRSGGVRLLATSFLATSLGSLLPAQTEWVMRIWTGRNGHALAYDNARGRVILFGGFTGPSFSLSDTWEWDGNVWTQRTPATSPPARGDHALAYDSARGRVVLFGGYRSSPSLLSDT